MLKTGKNSPVFKKERLYFKGRSPRVSKGALVERKLRLAHARASALIDSAPKLLKIFALWCKAIIVLRTNGARNKRTPF
jgi:hypothetical protein